jgi:membrane fusion protein, peptide pheromone/bacteriocin exporter
MIIEGTELKESVLWWLPSMRRSGFLIYWLVMGLFCTGFLSLFFIRVDISVRANGIIRPLNERTEIKSPVSGIVDTIYFKEGDQVVKNDILLELRDPALVEKQHLNESEIFSYRNFIHDLELLTSRKKITNALVSSLISPLYKQEALRFFSRSDEQQIILEKANHEFMLNEKLSGDKVISPKEFYDIRMQQQKVIASFASFQRDQFTNWQTDLVKYETDLNLCFSRQKELDQTLETNRIRASVSGCVQELNRLYTGNSIQAGESICSISPGGILMGECFVSSKDVGMLRTGQQVRFQFDALNYNYFGMGTGDIYSIDNDFILLEKSPVFKVKCHMNERNLKLSNGFTGELKKGMGFQARFITCNRSLWQLLYDGLDDWLNPAHRPLL